MPRPPSPQYGPHLVDNADKPFVPWSEAKKLQRPLADGELEIVHRTALKYLPGVDGIPSGDPLRMSVAPREPSLFR